MRKNEIAISQAGIAAPTLIVMQGFQGSVHLLSHSLVLREFPFSVYGIRARIELDCDGEKTHALTTRLHQTRCRRIKMSYVNQMYVKKATKGYA